MAEAGGPTFFGTGKPEGMPKKGFVQKVKEAFLPKYAKDRWFEKHAKEIEEFKAIESQLTPEQRAAAVKKIESRATMGAWGRVVTYWGGLAATVGTLIFGTKLIRNEEFRKAVGAKEFKLGWWKDAKIAKPGAVFESFGTKGATFLKKIAERANEYKTGERKIFGKKKPDSTPPVSLSEFYASLTDNPLAKINEAMPVAQVLQEFKGKTHKAFEEAFHSSSKEDIAGLFFELAEKKGNWSPLHLVDGKFQDGLTIRPGTVIDFWNDIHEFAQQGLVTVRDIGPKNISIEPTQALIELVRKYIAKE